MNIHSLISRDPEPTGLDRALSASGYTLVLVDTKDDVVIYSASFTKLETAQKHYLWLMANIDDPSVEFIYRPHSLPRTSVSIYGPERLRAARHHWRLIFPARQWIKQYERF